MSPDVTDRIVARLRQSARYRHLCDDVLAWAASAALRSSTSEKVAVKAAKRRLHQAFGAFIDQPRRKRTIAVLEQAAGARDPQRRRALLSEALSLHASTAERFDAPGGIVALWEAIRGRVGPVGSVLDLGCGLMPASLPWSGLPPDVRYLGVDLDRGLCAAVEAACRPDFPNVVLEASRIEESRRWPAADVVLLLKLLPTLERQVAGASEALIANLDATFVVASFPTRSLSGRSWGGSAYRQLADAVLGPGPTLQIGDEIVRIVHRGGSGEDLLQGR